jgi:hypothetical protein
MTDLLLWSGEHRLGARRAARLELSAWYRLGVGLSILRGPSAVASRGVDEDGVDARRGDWPDDL